MNYRLYSLASIVNKLYETIVKNRWLQYLEYEKNITEKQFGFRKEMSCVMNLPSFYKRIIYGVQKRDGLMHYIWIKKYSSSSQKGKMETRT